jgi:hypothetical protein
MHFPQVAMRRASPNARKFASLWASTVVSRGGTVSSARFELVASAIARSIRSGAWWQTDDVALLVAENSQSALVSLKRRANLTTVGSPVPAFTADAGYAFSGTARMGTGFIPSTNRAAMSGTSMRLSVYERTNVATNTMAAGSRLSATEGMHVNPRTAANAINAQANGTITNSATTITDSRGMTTVFKEGPGVYGFYKNGALVSNYDPAAETITLPTAQILIGCYNNNGSPTGHRASTLGFVAWGGALTAAQEAAEYTNWQTYMTAVGANV